MRFLLILFLFSSVTFGEKPIQLLGEQPVGIDTGCSINNFGNWLVASTLGAYLNGKLILTGDQLGRGTLAKINDRGDWLIVSQSGLYFNGKRLIKNVTLGVEFDVDLNFGGNWILAGNAIGVIINEIQVLDQQKVGISASVHMTDDGLWIVSSSAGVFSGKLP